MRRPARILLLVIVVALLPLRSMAAAISVCCGMAHESVVAAQPVPGAHDSQGRSGNADTHCPSAAFLPASAPAPLNAPSDENRLAAVPSIIPIFIPDNPYRPPLALPR